MIHNSENNFKCGALRPFATFFCYYWEANVNCLFFTKLWGDMTPVEKTKLLFYLLEKLHQYNQKIVIATYILQLQQM